MRLPAASVVWGLGDTTALSLVLYCMQGSCCPTISVFLHHSGGLDNPTPSSGLLAEERGLTGSNSFGAGVGSESIWGELISGLRLWMVVLGDR